MLAGILTVNNAFSVFWAPVSSESVVYFLIHCCHLFRTNILLSTVYFTQNKTKRRKEKKQQKNLRSIQASVSDNISSKTSYFHYWIGSLHYFRQTEKASDDQSYEMIVCHGQTGHLVV